MCTPLLAAGLGAGAGIGTPALSLISTGIGIAGSLAQMNAQRAQINRQRAANREYARIQQRESQRELARQDEYERRSREAHNQSIDQLRDVQDERDAEQERLNEQLQSQHALGAEGEVPEATINDALLSGQNQAGTIIRDDLARRLNDAAQQARTRIRGLADLQAYGGSQFGFNNTIARNFADTANQLDFLNNLRRGSQRAHQLYQSIQPGTAPTGQTGLYSRPTTTVVSGSGALF